MSQDIQQQSAASELEVPEYKPGEDYQFNDNIGVSGVPEPATLWLMLIGIILLAIWKIRYSKAVH